MSFFNISLLRAGQEFSLNDGRPGVVSEGALLDAVERGLFEDKPVFLEKHGSRVAIVGALRRVKFDPVGRCLMGEVQPYEDRVSLLDGLFRPGAEPLVHVSLVPVWGSAEISLVPMEAIRLVELVALTADDPAGAKPDYCVFLEVANCEVCSLSNYGRDCQNNKIGG